MMMVFSKLKSKVKKQYATNMVWLNGVHKCRIGLLEYRTTYDKRGKLDKGPKISNYTKTRPITNPQTALRSANIPVCTTTKTPTTQNVVPTQVPKQVF